MIQTRVTFDFRQKRCLLLGLLSFGLGLDKLDRLDGLNRFIQLGDISELSMGNLAENGLGSVQKNQTDSDPNQMPASKPPVDVDLERRKQRHVGKDHKDVVVVVELRRREAVQQQLGKGDCGHQAVFISRKEGAEEAAQKGCGDGDEAPELQVLGLFSLRCHLFRVGHFVCMLW